MMEQYRRVKKRYPDALVFFRFGDFYEMFYDDAALGSRQLNIALTSRMRCCCDIIENESRTAHAAAPPSRRKDCLTTGQKMRPGRSTRVARGPVWFRRMFSKPA